MSDRREFFGATVEEAVQKASAEMGVDREQLEFEVLDPGSTGFLGIGTRDARILVEHLATDTGTSDESADVRTPEPVPPEEPARADRTVEDEPDVAVSEAPYDLIVAVDEFMTALIEHMGLDATVDAYDDGDVILVQVATEETGLFIGQKGETIDAIQYLANVAVYRERPFVKRVIVDSEGYRQRRIAAIQGMAHRTARRAVREKRPLSLPPMSAAERRVVHMFLKQNPNVTTFSDGKAEDRRVIVSPV